jgi:hypothetical protein
MKRDENTKLTSVKINRETYSSFKKMSFDSNITLQTIVNRTLERYITDDVYRNEMNGYSSIETDKI